MAKLVYKPCACISQRGHAFVPGMRGHLYLATRGRFIRIRRCLRCAS